MAQIGVGIVAAAKLAIEMVNDAGGIKSLGGAKMSLIISDIQSDTTVTRTASIIPASERRAAVWLFARSMRHFLGAKQFNSRQEILTYVQGNVCF